MFLILYELCVTIFLFQGMAIPLLLVASGIYWRAQTRRLELLRRDVGAAGKKAPRIANSVESILEGLPKLLPLHCRQCGSALLLRESETYCQSCLKADVLPADYLEAGRLSRALQKVMIIATARWRIAAILVSLPARWFFRSMILIEPLVLLPITLIGSNLYRDTWIDNAVASAGEAASFLVFGAAFLGFVVWMIVFIFLAALSSNMQRKLPQLPASEARIQGEEMASCLSCGGAIEYDKNNWGCICSYCKVENLRVRFLRSERFQNERKSAELKFVLFGAMRIIDDFAGSFFVVLFLLSASATLYVAGHVILNYWNA